MKSPQTPLQPSPEPPQPCHKSGTITVTPNPHTAPRATTAAAGRGFTHTSKMGKVSFPFCFLFNSDRSKCDKENNRIFFIQMPLLPARAKAAQPKHRGRHEINSSCRVQGKFEIQIGMFSSYYKHWIFFLRAALAYLYYYHKAFWSYVCSSSHNNLFLKEKKKKRNSKKTVMQHR